MNLSELETIIDQALSAQSDGTKTFNVAGNAISSAINTLFWNHLPNSRLIISHAVKSKEGDKLIIIGDWNQNLASLPADRVAAHSARAEFSIVSNQPQVKVTLSGLISEGDNNWRLTRIFPELAGSLADRLIYSQPKLIISSLAEDALDINFQNEFFIHDHAQPYPRPPKILRPGLLFEADCRLADTTGILAWLMNRAEFHLSGSIYLIDQVPNMWLKSETASGEGTAIGSFRLPIRLELITYFIETTQEPYYLPVTRSRLSATISKSIGTHTLQIPVGMWLSDYDNTLITFEANLKQASQLAFEQLSGLLEDNPVSDLIPAEFPSLEDISLRLLNITIAPSAPASRLLQDITLGIELDKRWSIFSGLIEFHSLSALISVINPTNSQRRFEAHLRGKADISGGTIGARILIPSLVFWCELNEGTIDIKSLITSIFPGAIDMPQISCTGLKIMGDFKQKQFSIEAMLGTDWGFEISSGKSFVLKQVGLGISYSKALGNSSVSGYVSGKFEIAGVEIYVSAERHPNDAGWLFFGRTEPGQEVPIGTLINDLANLFGTVDLPPAIADLKLRDIVLSFNTKTKNFTFSCHASFPINESTPSDIQVDINILRQSDGTFSKHFSGELLIGSMRFQLTFSKDPQATVFAATHSQYGGHSIKIKDILGKISQDTSLIDAIPESLEISLNEALLVYYKGTSSKFILGLDVGPGFDLSDLPLVGKQLPFGQRLRLSFQILVASQNFTETEISNLTNFLELGSMTVPPMGLNKGLNLSTSLRMGEVRIDFPLPVGINRNNAGGSTAPIIPDAQPVEQDSIQWFPINRTFGPFSLNKIGAQYKDSDMVFLLDASFSLGGLSISLGGLGISTPLTEFSPTFHLRGLGIGYKKGPVEISGAFLRSGDDYYGKALIQLKKLSITAIGGYSTINGHPSLFIYAVLNMPIGGPPIFFITGLAAGFGYNRELKIPDIERVKYFPLVTAAMGQIQGGDQIPGMINSNDPAATLSSAIQAMVSEGIADSRV